MNLPGLIGLRSPVEDISNGPADYYNEIKSSFIILLILLSYAYKLLAIRGPRRPTGKGSYQ